MRQEHADASGSDLSDANLTDADFSSTDLREANLVGANLEKATLVRASLAGAKADKANFARIEGYRTSFAGMSAPGASFASAELQRADFSGAVLTGADFQKAELGRVNFSKANITGTSFPMANLSRAELRGATFEGPIDLTDAFLFLARLEELDLSQATGLQQLQIDLACGDAATKLPAGITTPATWPCKFESDSAAWRAISIKREFQPDAGIGSGLHDRLADQGGCNRTGRDGRCLFLDRGPCRGNQARRRVGDRCAGGASRAGRQAQPVAERRRHARCRWSAQTGYGSRQGDQARRIPGDHCPGCRSH